MVFYYFKIITKGVMPTIINNVLKKRRTANESSTRLSSPVGNLIKNSSSNDSILNKTENVNNNS